MVVKCGRWTIAAHWPVSLAESVSIKFPSKDPCDMETGREEEEREEKEEGEEEEECLLKYG